MTESNLLAGRIYQRVSGVAALILILMGATVLLGWFLDIEAFKSVFPGLVTMKANTAMGFLLLGISLALATFRFRFPYKRVVIHGLTGLVILLGLLSLAQYFFNINLGIDELLVQGDIDPVATSSPGRMSSMTAFAFIFLSGAVVAAQWERGRLSQRFALLAALLAFVSLTGYVYGAEALYTLAPHTGMAVHTTLSFLVAAMGILLLHPHIGLVSVFTSDNTAGRISRRLLPVAVLVPFFLGWLRIILDRNGLFAAELGTALLVIVTIIIIVLFIIQTADVVTTEETQRRLAELNYSESERRFELAIEAAPNAIIMVNQKGQIVLFNSRAEELFSYSRDEILGQNVDLLVPLRFRGEHTSFRAGFFQQPVVRPMGVGRELNGLRKDNTEFPVEIGLAPISMQNGDLVMATIVDITQRKQAEEELQSAIVELERSNEELEQFAYVASHDLQEPLRMVSSYMQLVERRYKDKLDEDGKEFIDFAVDGANRMQALINDLLAFSRVGTRGQELQPVDSEAALGRALSSLELAIEESATQVMYDALPQVLADRSQLELVFQNLISNAIKFRSDKIPVVQIHIERQDEFYCFAVQDNSIGIEEKHLERIFVLFQRLHTRDEYSGTGIGLAICKKIIERHGGKMWAESKIGKGTTFFFTLQAVSNFEKDQGLQANDVALD